MISLYFTLLLFSLQAPAFDKKDFAQWEDKILKEVQKLEKTQPEKVYWLYLAGARELTLFHYKEKASQYYEKALKTNPKSEDKTEIYIQLVNLNRDNKSKVESYLKNLDQWFESHPEKATPEIKEWMKVVKGTTPVKNVPPFLLRWATDHKIVELMKENKFKEAYSLVSPEGLEVKDINSKIEYDVLSSLVVGKESPRLYCGPALKKYPNSIAWPIRICRYLTDWKNGTKSTESVSTIRQQLKTEDPKRIFYADVLEKL
ncbi:MAG TPA: hypothetical protein VNJ08_07290 [Bacteriovoracaceae bacterium]|nr:hypothetical protein [Bacteriovoracaceae bacterium]